MTTVTIQIKSIEKIQNEITIGHLQSDEVDLGIKFDKKSKFLSIRWTFKFNLESNRCIVHKSKTVFETQNLSLDRLLPSEVERIDLFTQLAQISMAHSRTLFVTENPILNYIPAILWNHQIKDQMIMKINQLSN